MNKRKGHLVIDLTLDDSDEERCCVEAAACEMMEAAGIAWTLQLPKRFRTTLIAPSCPPEPARCTEPWCLSPVVSAGSLCGLCEDVNRQDVGARAGLVAALQAPAPRSCDRDSDFTCLFGFCNALAATDKWYCAEHALLREGFVLNK
jgi:hypothetical protein